MVAQQIDFGRFQRTHIKYLFLNNRPYQGRATLVDVNSNETIFTQLLPGLISVAGDLIISIIHMLKYEFQIK